MFYETPVIILTFSFILMAGMFILLELGRNIGTRHRLRSPEKFQTGTGVVDAAVFGLMGLMLAFTFSGAATRWEMRRALVVQEANAIATAYIRLDLLPPASQAKLKEDFRRYLRSRLAIYRTIPEDLDAARTELKHSESLQREIWEQAAAAGKETGSPAVLNLVLSAINEMFVITTTRTAAFRAHLPSIVFIMLGVTMLASSLLAGYNMAANEERKWVHVISYVLLLGTVAYLVIELEFPRIGHIRIDRVDEVLVETLERMK